jgi:signal peptidase I
MAKHSRRSELLAGVCNVFGILILLCVIATCLSVMVPRLMGYQIYNVVSGSMEPEISVGSAIFVKGVAPEDVQEGDIIAFRSGDSVISHRVVRNQTVEGTFTTKGDANADEDMNPVAYDDLIGQVTRHIPMLGDFMTVLTGTVGKVYMIAFAACGAMLNILASRIRQRSRAR